MSSLRPQDRVSLCLFTFTDGRRCRTPRSGAHPHFCFYHARKESQARIAEKLSNDLYYFLSGDYVSACDLSTALGRLISAVARGDIKPKAANTLAFLAQTLSQTIRLSQDEYINAFGTDGWRQAVRDSVNLNSDYLHPEPAEPEEPEPSPAPPQVQQPVQPHPPAASPVQPVPQTPGTVESGVPLAPQTSVGAGLVYPEPGRARADTAPQSVGRPTPPAAADEALSIARSLFPRLPKTPTANPFRSNIHTPPRNR
jgi:hypothetical protein